MQALEHMLQARDDDSGLLLDGDGKGKKIKKGSNKKTKTRKKKRVLSESGDVDGGATMQYIRGILLLRFALPQKHLNCTTQPQLASQLKCCAPGSSCSCSVEAREHRPKRFR